jgi:hypothetical protein
MARYGALAVLLISIYCFLRAMLDLKATNQQGTGGKGHSRG